MRRRPHRASVLLALAFLLLYVAYQCVDVARRPNSDTGCACPGMIGPTGEDLPSSENPCVQQCVRFGLEHRRNAAEGDRHLYGWAAFFTLSAGGVAFVALRRKEPVA